MGLLRDLTHVTLIKQVVYSHHQNEKRVHEALNLIPEMYLIRDIIPSRSATVQCHISASIKMMKQVLKIRSFEIMGPSEKSCLKLAIELRRVCLLQALIPAAVRSDKLRIA